MTTPASPATEAGRALLDELMLPGRPARRDYGPSILAIERQARQSAALTRTEDVARRLHHGGWTKGAPRRGEPDRMRLWLAAARDLLEGYQP